MNKRRGYQVENLGANVDEWYRRPNNGNGSSTFDVCSVCWRTLGRDPHAFDAQLQPYNGDPAGDAGRGGDCEARPPYEDSPAKCEVCKAPLRDATDQELERDQN